MRVHADLRNKWYIQWVNFLREAENWSSGEIVQYQLSEIKRIVDYAYRNTKGYRRLYDKYGVTPQMISEPEDLRKFPLVEKEMIRDSLDAFSLKSRGSRYVTTGGSTGIPFGFYQDKVAFSRELASKAHQYYRVGWKEGMRQLVFRGIPIINERRMQFYPRFNEMRCSSYHLTPESMEVFRRKAFKFMPEFVRCYPSSGYLFARFLRETKRDFPEIKGILCASENLYDYQKDLLKEVFGARVFSHYGHYELAVLAGFCEYDDTYHVLPQYGYAELLSPDGQPVTKLGQMGEIVATSFIMHATPFIRYRTRDYAVFKSWACSSCGRPYQIWDRIEGRLQEFIVTRAGRYISMTAINMHDDIFDHLNQFQFYQEEKGRVTFRYIPKDKLSDDDRNDIRKRLMVKLGDDILLDMEAVENIPLTQRGKHRFLIQNMDIPFGDN